MITGACTLLTTMVEVQQGERDRIDETMQRRGIDAETRQSIWGAVDSILQRGPQSETGAAGRTGLALGYVQSGKTTAITALIAAAADAGYRVVIALMGSTNLLLQQNQERLEQALGLVHREDYRWVQMSNPSGVAKAKELRNWLDRGRVVLVPVLKHAGRIDALANVLTRVGALTSPRSSSTTRLTRPASTRRSTKALRAGHTSRSAGSARLPQDTCTCSSQPLRTHPCSSSRTITSDQTSSSCCTLAPATQVDASSSWTRRRSLSGRSLLSTSNDRSRCRPSYRDRSSKPSAASSQAQRCCSRRTQTAAPVSMLVHSTQRNDIQARYHFLLQRLVKRWRDSSLGAPDVGSLPAEVVAERERLVASGAQDTADAAFLDRVRYVLGGDDAVAGQLGQRESTRSTGGWRQFTSWSVATSSTAASPSRVSPSRT